MKAIIFTITSLFSRLLIVFTGRTMSKKGLWGTLFLINSLFLIPGMFRSIPHHGEKYFTKESVKRIIEEEVVKLMKQPEYAAVSGVLYIKGKAWPFHYGLLGNGKKPDNNTLYEIGSITKTYTGLLLSQAVYDHKIKLDDDIRNYLDDKYPNLVLSNSQPITFRHLITHTAGLPLVMNCYEDEQTIPEQQTCFENFNEKDFFTALKEVKLIDNSGQNYHYSGVGTQLVGYILERVYQMPFQELFKKYIFSRSGEQQTVSEFKYIGQPNISIGKNSDGLPMPLINGFYKYSGGMKSTTGSMLRYIQLYLETKDPVVHQAMGFLKGSLQYGRAYAWNTYNFDKTKKMLYHNGGSFGHSSWIALYPNQKTGIFIVTNVVTADSQTRLNELSNHIIDRLKIDAD